MKSCLLLQYIIPYLEYELKILSNQNEIQTLFGIRDKTYFIKETRNNYAYSDVSDIKIILKPLCDFYDINAPAFIDTNFDISTQLVLVDLCSKKQHYSGIRYSDMQEFLKYHIDVFNLIEQDLAISIHDVGYSYNDEDELIIDSSRTKEKCNVCSQFLDIDNECPTGHRQT